MNASSPLRIGTRGSPLALAQAREARRLLALRHPALAGDGATEIVVIKTTGDKVLDRTLAEIGGKGLFTKEIDEALADARIDVAVHSMKDVPTRLPDGFALAAVLKREDWRDAFLSKRAARLADLAPGAVVGTASLRRAAQILYRRPDLVVRPLRGNVQTRMARLDEGAFDATLLAVAGLKRLGMAEHVTCPLAPEEMLPAVAQGAIGVVCRADDRRVLDFVAPLDHRPSRLQVTAERALLAVLDGSCRTPIAALGEIDAARLRLRGLVLRPDGSAAVAGEATGPADDAEAIGRAVGRDILDRCGPGFVAALGPAPR